MKLLHNSLESLKETHKAKEDKKKEEFQQLKLQLQSLLRSGKGKDL